MAQMIEFLDDALLSPRGIALQSVGITARQLRKQFYALRERLRIQGNKQYDCLSFIPNNSGELRIIRRDLLPMPDKTFAVRQLQPSELPPRVLARGKHKPGLLFQELLRELKL